MYVVSVLSRLHLGAPRETSVPRRRRRPHLAFVDRHNRLGRIPIDSVIPATGLDICRINFQLHGRLEGPEET